MPVGMPTALRPIRLTDLPRLRRWRGLATHLRHPGVPSWRHHLRWWWRTRHDPTCWVRAVVDVDGQLCGTVGVYYIGPDGGEVSVLCADDQGEHFGWELSALALLFRAHPIRDYYATVYPGHPERYQVFDTMMRWLPPYEVPPAFRDLTGGVAFHYPPGPTR